MPDPKTTDLSDERIAEIVASLWAGGPEIERMARELQRRREAERWKLPMNEISRINRERCEAWHTNGLMEWSVVDWSNAMAGEAGEVCNAVKKFRRIETGVPQSRGPKTIEEATADIAKEIGDTFLYLDLLAQRLGIDIQEAIAKTFNRVSEREGLPQYMPLPTRRRE